MYLKINDKIFLSSWALKLKLRCKHFMLTLKIDTEKHVYFYVQRHDYTESANYFKHNIKIICDF